MSDVIPDKALLKALDRKVLREKRARQEAERLLEEKSLQLFDANQALIGAQSELMHQLGLVELEKDRVLKQSMTDTLTQLPTRSAFLEQLEQDLKDLDRALHCPDDRQLWLVVVRLKQFKQINEALGQFDADAVLRETARRLEACALTFRGTVARFGGTQFALSFYSYRDDLEEKLDKVADDLQQEIHVNGRTARPRVSIAAAGSYLAGETCETFRSAVDHVDTLVKRSTDRSILIYDDAQKARLLSKRQLETDLKQSLRKQEIVPWYQPIVYTHTRDAICVEALARWPRQNGQVRPDEFIPVANELGLWGELDQKLVLRAFEEIKPLVERGVIKDLSINVSPAQLVMPDFISKLKDLLDTAVFPPDHLILEVTEEVMIDDVGTVTSQIVRLRELGIKIAIDDFGTGYSNLKGLIGLPVDAVKIDKSLVEDITLDNRAAMLVSALVQYARAINVSVVAEGVETETQGILLSALGCSRLQGYYFGPAMPVETLNAQIPDLLKLSQLSAVAA